MTTEFLRDFIAAHKYAVLSTVTKDNCAQAAAVGIAVTPELEIVFDTTNTSRKHLNLVRNPSIAFVIGCEGEQTIQYEGIARIPAKDELDRLLDIYFKVFPDGRERRENWKDLVYFCVTPKWIRYSDFNTPQIIEEHILNRDPL